MPRLLEERAAPELLGDDDGHEVGLAARQPPHLVEHRLDGAAAAVERLEERRPAREVEPARPDPRVGAVTRDVDRAEPVRRDRAREREAAFGRLVEGLDDEERRVPRVGSRGDGCSAGAQPPRDAVVVPPHAEHRDDEQRDRDRHEPGAFAELRADDDHGDEAGRRRADRVDERSAPPPGAADAQPVAHHPHLRDRERGEDADHVEVDEAVGVRLVDDEQCRGGRGEHEHPVREDEAVAEVRELPRREAVAGEQRREPREALERRVRREDQDEQRRRLHDVVHEAAERSRLEDGPRDLETTESVALGSA